MTQLHPNEMGAAPLTGFFARSIGIGQHQLADSMRRRIYRAAPALAERLDFADDGIYLEPLLFTAFRGAGEPGERQLSQLLSGYMAPADRHPEIAVVTDEYGVVHLPPIGYFRTGLGDTELQLRWTGDARIAQLSAAGTLVESVFESPIMIPGTRIEIARASHPLLRPLLAAPGLPVAGACADPSQAQVRQLGDAAACVGIHLPHYLEYIQAVTRRVLLFAGSPYSFATIGAHGMAFLNVSGRASRPFFIEDLVHQCGHVIFNAITLDRDAFLAVDPRRSLRDVLGVDDDGSIYGAYHGLFTQAHINQCLSSLYRAGTFCGAEQHELAGRMADDMKRFALALDLLGRRELYTELGWSLLQAFRATFDNLYTEHRDLIVRLDTSNQPYIFDYEAFIERNPLPGGEGARSEAP